MVDVEARHTTLEQVFEAIRSDKFSHTEVADVVASLIRMVHERDIRIYQLEAEVAIARARGGNGV